MRKLRDLVKGREAKDVTAAEEKLQAYERPKPPPGVKPIGSLTDPGKATVEGRVRAIEIRPVEHNSVLACEISDSTGDLTALFYGRAADRRRDLRIHHPAARAGRYTRRPPCHDQSRLRAGSARAAASKAISPAARTSG